MKKIIFVLVIILMIPAFAGAAIHSLQVSNNTNSAATISWITDGENKGEVHYSESPDLSNLLTADDIRGAAFEGCTHYVDIKKLKKETLYYFEVVSGGEVDDNDGNYYSFKTMKEPFAPPGICLQYGYVYQEDGSTAATGAIAYLWVTHNGEESYPLSRLIDSRGKDNPAFVFNIREARGVDTDNLFPSINIGDSIHLEAFYCGGYIAHGDMAFEGCTYNCGSMACSSSGSTTPTTSPTTTPTIIPSPPPPGPATTSISTTSSAFTTTVLSTTTTSETPPLQCEVIINLPSANVSPWEKMQCNASTFCDGKAVKGNYLWYVNTTVGSKIDEKGLYKAGAFAGTDTVTVIDTFHGNIMANDMIDISPLWPMAYDEMWGAKKGENLTLLRKFRDRVLTNSELGRDYIFMLYSNSLEILILLLQNPSLTEETKEVIDELLPGIQSLLEGKKITLSEEKIEHIETLLKHFEKKALNLQLKNTIKRVRMDLMKGIIFNQFGVMVVNH